MGLGLGYRELGLGLGLGLALRYSRDLQRGGQACASNAVKNRAAGLPDKMALALSLSIGTSVHGFDLGLEFRYFT